MREYCVDLEIAKELKENGFPQDRDSYYWIIAEYAGSPKQGDICNYLKYNPVAEQYEVNRFLAPTSDEILKELPMTIEKDGDIYEREIINQFLVKYTYYYFEAIDSLPEEDIEDDKLSNALAKTWLYLKKEGYIK